MYRFCGLRLGPNLGMRPAADKKFYLRLTVQKMHTFVLFTEKYLRPCGCSDTNVTAAVNCANQSEITDIEIIEIIVCNKKIYLLVTNVFTRS